MITNNKQAVSNFTSLMERSTAPIVASFADICGLGNLRQNQRLQELTLQVQPTKAPETLFLAKAY